MYASRLVLNSSRSCSKSVLITFCPNHGHQWTSVQNHSSSSKILASPASATQPKEPISSESKSTLSNDELKKFSLNDAISFNPVVHRPNAKAYQLIELIKKSTYVESPEKRHLLYNHQHQDLSNSESDTIKLLNSELLTWKPVETLTPPNLIKYWLRLAKFRLTSLVVMTTMAGYWMAAGTIDPVRT